MKNIKHRSYYSIYSLSFNVDQFQLPRDKSKTGKGAFWTIDRNVGEMFEKGNYRRRKRRGQLQYEIKVAEKKLKDQMSLEEKFEDRSINDIKPQMAGCSDQSMEKRAFDNPYSIERILSM